MKMSGLFQFRPQFLAFWSKTMIPNSIRVTLSESKIFALSIDTKLKKCSHAPFKGLRQGFLRNVSVYRECFADSEYVSYFSQIILVFEI